MATYEQCNIMTGWDYRNDTYAAPYNLPISWCQFIFAGKIDYATYDQHSRLDANWPLMGLKPEGGMVFVPKTSSYAKYDTCCQTFLKHNDPKATSPYCSGVYTKTGNLNTTINNFNCTSGAGCKVEGTLDQYTVLNDA